MRHDDALKKKQGLNAIFHDLQHISFSSMMRIVQSAYLLATHMTETKSDHVSIAQRKYQNSQIQVPRDVLIPMGILSFVI